MWGGNLIVVLIWISLTIIVMFSIFLYLLAICISLERDLFESFVHVWIFLCCSNCRRYLCIRGINPLPHLWFANIFCHSVGCLFTSLEILLNDVESPRISAKGSWTCNSSGYRACAWRLTCAEASCVLCHFSPQLWKRLLSEGSKA